MKNKKNGILIAGMLTALMSTTALATVDQECKTDCAQYDFNKIEVPTLEDIMSSIQNQGMIEPYQRVGKCFHSTDNSENDFKCKIKSRKISPDMLELMEETDFKMLLDKAVASKDFKIHARKLMANVDEVIIKSNSVLNQKAKDLNVDLIEKEDYYVREQLLDILVQFSYEYKNEVINQQTSIKKGKHSDNQAIIDTNDFLKSYIERSNNSKYHNETEFNLKS